MIWSWKRRPARLPSEVNAALHAPLGGLVESDTMELVTCPRCGGEAPVLIQRCANGNLATVKHDCQGLQLHEVEQMELHALERVENQS